MKKPTQISLRAFCTAFCATLLFPATSTSLAATADPSASTSATGAMQELEEVWIRGKQLSDVIEDAEDQLFRRYNQLNKTNKFDIQCGYARLDRDSLAMKRTCMPQYMAGIAASPGSISVTPGPTISNAGFLNGASAGWFWIGDLGAGSNWSISQGANQTMAKFALQGSPQFQATRQEYIRNFVRVLYSDAELMQQVDKLAGLYAEMASVRESYVEVKTVDEARQGPSGRRSGPRL